MQPKSFNSAKLVQISIAILISSLLLYTGLHKWWYLPYTILKLHASPVKWIGAQASLIAWALPALEIVISCLILFPARRKFGFVLSAILFAAFTLYLVVLRNAPPGTVCSCGGFIGSLNLKNHLLLVALALALSLVGVSISRSANSNASIYKNNIRG